jgi:ParB-like chromosome segregation protein Spo0J
VNLPPYKLQPIADLIPYARNARTHSDAQVAKIASSIREFGFTNPVLTDGDKGIIAGHGRVLAARKLGMKEVPTIELSHLSVQQRKAYIIADNRLALDAGWDNALLSLELSELKDDGFDLAVIGFEAGELTGLLAGPSDSAPPSSAKEIDPDEYQMGCKCPRCGFEFDDKQ